MKNALRNLEKRLEKPVGLTLCEIHLLYEIGFEVACGREVETITQNAADICRKCGFTVKEKGIGWVISFDKEE